MNTEQIVQEIIDKLDSYSNQLGFNASIDDIYFTGDVLLSFHFHYADGYGNIYETPTIHISRTNPFSSLQEGLSIVKYISDKCR